jgi:hypothetical protein
MSRPAASILLAAAGLALAVGSGANAAKPDVVVNTIDPVATRFGDGRQVRVTDPIGCMGGRITIEVRIDAIAGPRRSTC